MVCTLLLTLTVVVAIASQPACTETVLRWASVGGALTFDPHSVDETPTYAQVTQVYEYLVDVDSSLDLVPALAVEWKLLDPLTWEFKLREGVRFHDGRPFGAEDVAFSIERAKTEPSEKTSYIASVADVQAIDTHLVHISTSVPDALLPIELATIEIMSKSWADEHGVTRPADFGAGEETYATRHANGTGPFMLEEYRPGGRTVMVRNPDWWGFERFPHNIERIVYTPIADPKERLAALLEGKIDLLTDPPFAALDRLRTVPGWTLKQAPELRSIFFGLDQASPELRSSNVKGRNPFSDRRVRRAMYQAIDAGAIRDGVMRGLSLPAGMIIPPGVNGYSPELDRRLPYDPKGAKALLAEAGYADGFGVTLLCPLNRYINDEAICRAMAAQLREIGIDVTVEALPKDLRGRKMRNRETDFYMVGWGVGTLDSLEVFLAFFHSQGGPFNATGYANPRVDELIEVIRAEMVTYARDALIEEVWRLVLTDIVYLPLHHQVIVWAMRENLDIPVLALNRPVFREARFR